MVNTRSMVRPQSKTNLPCDSIVTNSETDQLAVWQTENPSEVNKILKLGSEVHQNQIKLILYNHNYNKILGTTILNIQKQNGSQTLAFAFLELGKILKKYKRDKIALSTEDNIFKYISMHALKEIVNTTISNYEIIIFKPPKLIKDKQEIQDILKQNHTTPTSGHIGQTRLYLKLRELVKWKNMKKDISDYIKNCDKCKYNKIVRHTKQPTIITTTPTKPFEVISADTIGPFTRTNNGNRYILSVQCNLTKYIVLIPIPTKESAIIAKSLVEHFILTYGKFLELRTDQGLEYKNEILKKVCDLLEIKQTFSTAYHPQTIGALERNHRCLNEYLRSFTNAHQTDWDDWIKFYAFSFNTTPHTEHSFSPFELVFGRKATLPNDLKLKPAEPVYNLEAYYNELKFRLARSNSIAHDLLIKNKINNQQYCNKTINPIDISIGDQVKLIIENNRKLDPCYIGPYKVIEIDEPNCTLINPITEKTTIVHKNRIQKL